LTVLRALYFELDDAICLGKQCVVSSATDIHARVYPGTALANDDAASFDHLATENLDAKTFGF
jgi:hypothetical protein